MTTTFWRPDGGSPGALSGGSRARDGPGREAPHSQPGMQIGPSPPAPPKGPGSMAGSHGSSMGAEPPVEGRTVGGQSSGGYGVHKGSQRARMESYLGQSE